MRKEAIAWLTGASWTGGPEERRFLHSGVTIESDYVVGLWALCSLNDVVLDCVALFKGLVTFVLDGCVMDEDIRAAVASQKSKAFCVIEPLHCSPVFRHVEHLSQLEVQEECRHFLSFPVSVTGQNGNM